MRCRHFFSFVLVVFLSLFFGSFITSDSTFAVADISILIDSSTTINRGQPVFPDCDSSCFSQYHYFIFEPLSYVLSSGSDFRFTLSVPGYSNKNLFLPTLVSSYVSLSSDISSILYYSTAVPSDFSFRLTLSESLPSSSSPPSGNLDITSNGTYDVSSYATATVDVPAEVIQGDYHDDLINIKNSIITCGAILLVLYFFYCIYRLIIKNSGVK